MTLPIETTMNEKDHDDAFTELAFLLHMLASTVEDVIGNPAPLGVSAGRAMANRLPVRLSSPPLGKALEVLGKALEGGMAFSCQEKEKGAILSVGPCAVRALCQLQNEPVGSKVCKLFHHYISGMASQLYGKQARIVDVDVGETCTLDLTTR